MEQFAENFGRLQPQLVSIVLVALILITLAIVVYIKVGKAKPYNAPSPFLLMTEQYVTGCENLFQSITRNKVNPMAPYIFTLLSFLLVGNLMGLIGFDPPASSYSVPLVLGLVAWTGIYVVGLSFQKWRWFIQFAKNPIDILGQFSPLISISLRLFGNMIAGTTILYLIGHFFGWLWGHIPGLGQFNLLVPLVTPPFRVYFDVFDGIIQAYVFTLLTMMYWSLQFGDEIPEQAKEIDPKKEVLLYQGKSGEKKKQKVEL